MSQVHCSSSSFDRRLCKFIPFSKRNLLTDLELKPFLLGNLSPHLGVCFSLSYYKILNVLSTEVVHVWKSDCMVNTNFPLPPFQRSVAWEGREGDRGKKNHHANGPISLPLGQFCWRFWVFWLENKNWKLIVIFNFSKPCHRLQHGRKSKIAAQFNFSLYCWQD